MPWDKALLRMDDTYYWANLWKLLDLLKPKHMERKMEELLPEGRFSELEVLKDEHNLRITLCLDTFNNEEVIIKALSTKHWLDQEVKGELFFLKQLKGSEFIVWLDDRYIADFLQCEILEYISSRSLNLFIKPDEPFEEPHLRRYAKSLLEALNFLKEEGVVHGNINPKNILVKDHTSGQIKLAGLSCAYEVASADDDHIMGKAGYLAPDIMLGLKSGTHNDMFSLGCVFVEMAMAKRMLKIRCFMQAIAGIYKIIGKPSKKILEGAPYSYNFFDISGKLNFLTKDNMPRCERLEVLLEPNSEVFQDFIRDLLCWDGSERPTPNDALNHHWMTDLTEPKSNDSVVHCLEDDECLRTDCPLKHSQTRVEIETVAPSAESAVAESAVRSAFGSLTRDVDLPPFPHLITPMASSASITEETDARPTPSKETSQPEQPSGLLNQLQGYARSFFSCFCCGCCDRHE